MYKKITSIQIENFRAYYGKYSPINLAQGENVLIYGENGSGKSSLYKAINNYFSSSNNAALPFIKNRYQSHLEGDITLSFSDFDDLTNQQVVGSTQSYTFGSLVSNNQINFIQTAASVNGFLDYTDLLKVYFHKEARPNLFELIVLDLLGNHIPVSSGGIFKFKEKWSQLNNDLIDLPYTRNDRCHQAGLRDLPIFNAHLVHSLDEVFVELNRLLSDYFPDLNINLSYDLQPLTFNYGQRWEWHITSDLRLGVTVDGINITGDYSDYLNEARLSAISICLYLASLLRNPSLLEYKILYLDDVFIGLDAGNRLPILNILRIEFSSYQKFISTYDRHWFELAKRHFQVYNDKTWQSIEIYVGKEDLVARQISKPIVLEGLSNYEKAIRFLHNRERPDYPASANYFRKALEELIQNFIPHYELLDSENTHLPDYQLTQLLHRSRNFLEKTDNDFSDFSKVIGLLHNLLHPLSHHEITSPIYKNELILLETTFSKINNDLTALDIPNNYRCILEKGKVLRFTFTIDLATNYICYYEVVLNETLILKKDNAGLVSISLSTCYTKRCHGTNNGTPLRAYSPNRNDPNFNYISLNNAAISICAFLTNSGLVYTLPGNYIDIIEYNDGINWNPLNSILIW